jgi:hypothetical protein
MQRAPFGKLCPRCYSGALRPSRMTSGDARLLITLRRPVRCQDCGQQAYVFAWQALTLRQRSQVSTQLKRGGTSWVPPVRFVLVRGRLHHSDADSVILVASLLQRPSGRKHYPNWFAFQAASFVFATSNSAIRRRTKCLSRTKAGSSGGKSARCSTRARVERRISTRLGDTSATIKIWMPTGTIMAVCS